MTVEYKNIEKPSLKSKQLSDYYMHGIGKIQEPVLEKSNVLEIEQVMTHVKRLENNNSVSIGNGVDYLPPEPKK